MKIYGSLNNRIDENRMFCEKIEVGTPVTEYLWSDRHAYYVSNIIDDKNIEIKRYITKRTDNDGCINYQEYEYIENPTSNPIKLRFFKGKWHKVVSYTKTENEYHNVMAVFNLTAKQIEKFDRGETVTKLGDVMNISFGIADEYYDPCF